MAAPFIIPTHVIAMLVAALCIAAVALWIVAATIRRLRPGDPVMASPECRGCGYPVYGWSSTRCPECSTDCTNGIRFRVKRSRITLFMWACFLASIGWAIAIHPWLGMSLLRKSITRHAVLSATWGYEEKPFRASWDHDKSISVLARMTITTVDDGSSKSLQEAHLNIEGDANALELVVLDAVPSLARAERLLRDAAGDAPPAKVVLGFVDAFERANADIRHFRGSIRGDRSYNVNDGVYCDMKWTVEDLQGVSGYTWQGVILLFATLCIPLLIFFLLLCRLLGTRQIIKRVDDSMLHSLEIGPGEVARPE